MVLAAEAITADLQRRRRDVAQIDVAMKSGALLTEMGNELVTALQAEIAEWSQHLRVLMAEYPTLATEIAKRAQFSGRIAELAAKLAEFQIGVTKFDAIKDLEADAERAGVIKRVPKGSIVIGFGPQAVCYGPASEDPAVLRFVSDFADFILKFEEKGRDIRDSRRSEVAEFLLTREQVAVLKDHENTVKSLLGFFSGQGQYIFVPVIGHDVRTREERFEGEILLERRNHEMLATHATFERLAHSVFGWFDKQAGVWKKHGKQAVLALKKDDGGHDLDSVRNNTLREALGAKLAKDASWQQTRDAARSLRDVSSVDGKAITMAELFRNEKGTAVVNVRLRVGEGKSVWATMRVLSDGKQAHISAYAPSDLPDVLYYERRVSQKSDEREKVFWLRQYLEPQDPAMFRQDRQWQYIATANLDFEANWLYVREAEKLGAVALSADNVDGLCALEGADGLYGINRATHGIGTRRVPLRFICERNGNEVAVVWTAPGQSWRMMHDSVGESLRRIQRKSVAKHADDDRGVGAEEPLHVADVHWRALVVAFTHI